MFGIWEDTLISPVVAMHLLSARELMASSAALQWCMLHRWTLGSKLRILRTMFISAALRGAEASSVSERSLWRLRSAFGFRSCCLVWSFCLWLILELSSPLLDGPLGSDPAFHVVW